MLRRIPATTVLGLLLIPSPGLAQSEPFKVFDTKPVVTQGPYLVATSGTTATIVWLTDSPSHAAVRYAKGAGLPASALARVVESGRDGLLDVGLRHVVTLTGLEPGATYSYRIVSTRVVRLKAYWPDKGLSAESDVHQFTTLDPRKPTVAFSFITDTHEDVNRIRALNDAIDWKSSEFLVHGGDAFHWLDNEDQLFRLWLEPTTTALRHSVPLMYVRGNHEMRGPFARRLFDYVPTPEGRFYYARDAGPVHLIVLDTGEDKADDTNVYAGLNRTTEYRAKELAWLRAHVRNHPRAASAPFRVIAMHQPRWGWLANGNAEWIATANEAGVDLVLAGHMHRFRYEPPGKEHGYHLVVVGQDQVARVDAWTTELTVTVTALGGKVVHTLTIPRAAQKNRDLTPAPRAALFRGQISIFRK
jgi:predicted phosphodiesterase